MKALTFTVELLQPLLVTQLGSGDENSASSLDYIPGSVLRNALAARYIAANQLGDKAANDPQCRSLFFDDRVFVLNALPADRMQRRSLPTPLSWYAEKDALARWKAGASYLNLTDAATDGRLLQDMTNAKTLDQNDRYCCLNEEGVEFVYPKRQVSVHISRKHQRKLETKNDTQVFAYDTLAEGEVLCGTILARDEELLALMKKLLAEAAEMNIGGSRSAGYGRIRIREVAQNADWRETITSENDEATIIVTLLSDAIVRDPRGQFSNDISALIGAKEPQWCYRKMKQTGGFNRKWGLPLPQAHALQAGSVFVYAENDVDQRQLQQCLEEGLGERRSDGFGRIAVNWNVQSEIKAQRSPRESRPQEISLARNPVAQRLAQRIVEHQLRKQLDQALQKIILEPTVKGGSKSTFARVRLAARRAVVQQSLKPLSELLKDIDRKPAGKTLRDARRGAQSLLDWLNERIEKRDVEYQLKPEIDKVAHLGDVRAELTDALKIEYTARLIEGVARHAQKEAHR